MKTRKLSLRLLIIRVRSARIVKSSIVLTISGTRKENLTMSNQVSKPQDRQPVREKSWKEQQREAVKRVLEGTPECLIKFQTRMATRGIVIK